MPTPRSFFNHSRVVYPLTMPVGTLSQNARFFRALAASRLASHVERA
jgi:hypothetical protein